LLGIDDNNDLLVKAKSRLQQKGCTFSDQLLHIDIRRESIEKTKQNSSSLTNFDHVVCFQGLDLVLESADSIKNILQNVSHLLKDGGYFFGIFMDSSAIWSAVQKSLVDSRSLPSVSNKLFQIHFQSAEFQHIGCPYTFVLDLKTHSHYLIHLPTFCKHAEEFNLKMISLLNCNEFYEDHKKNFGDLLNRALQQGKAERTIDQDQKQIIGFYTTFVFQKILSK